MRNDASNAMGRRVGLTLVELLVVIAIMSFLAAILFPVFGRASSTIIWNGATTLSASGSSPTFRLRD